MLWHGCSGCAEWHTVICWCTLHDWQGAYLSYRVAEKTSRAFEWAFSEHRAVAVDPEWSEAIVLATWMRPRSLSVHHSGHATSKKKPVDSLS